MKPGTAMWLCLMVGLLCAIVGLRDIFAPGFLTLAPRVMGKLDITLQFVSAALFLIAAAGFYMSGRKVHGIKQK